MSESDIDAALARVADPALRATLEHEIALLRGSRKFGLVFDRRLPETVRLPSHPVRKGVTVVRRDESDATRWVVNGFAARDRRTAVLAPTRADGAHAHLELPVDELVVIREFGQPIYPGLNSVERLDRGAKDDPWHAVINGENFHVLQALTQTHRAAVDLVYIDPPFPRKLACWPLGCGRDVEPGPGDAEAGPLAA